MGAEGGVAGLAEYVRRQKSYYNVVPICARTEARAKAFVRWFDHGLLRERWTNQAEIAAGVLRSNHPSPERLAILAQAGLKSVLSLRGLKPTAHFHLETKACRDLGLTFLSVGLSDKRAPTVAHFEALMETFSRIERPFLIHCKAGADRAGLASAIYLMEFEGHSFDQARSMLSRRYGHIRWSKAGILDEVLDAYGRRLASGPVRFLKWAQTDYDPDAISAGFRMRRKVWKRTRRVPALH